MDRSGLEHPLSGLLPVGLGTVKLGRNTAVKYPDAFDLPSEAEVEALLEFALEAGIQLFDTAPAYGESERRLSSFVGRHRHEIVLCGKCGERFVAGESSYDFAAQSLIESVECSLKRLDTDHLDILLLHSHGRDLEILEQTDALEALRQLKAAGKVCSVGISAKTPEGIARAAQELDFIMAPYSRSDAGLGAAMQGAHDAGCGVLAIKTLGSGHLAAAGGAEDALRFALSQDFIDAIIVGTLQHRHLAQAVGLARELRGD